MEILSGFASYLAKCAEIPGDPRGGSPDDFRRDIIAGPHGRIVLPWHVFLFRGYLKIHEELDHLNILGT